MMAQAANLNSHVLVLNKLWMAIRIIDARRAFSLLFRDMAQVVRVDDESYVGYDFSSWAELTGVKACFNQQQHDYDYVKTVSMDLAVPKVVRLLSYSKVPKTTIKLNRRNIYARDHNLCQYCGKHFPTTELSLDHVKPRSQGGGSSWQNLVCCCVRCNSRKGGRTPLQAQMRLITKPVKPRRCPAVVKSLSHAKYASWQPFLDNAYWSVELV